MCIVLYKALYRTHKDMVARMNSHINIAKRNLLNFSEHTQLIELSKQQCQWSYFKAKWELQKKPQQNWGICILFEEICSFVFLMWTVRHLKYRIAFIITLKVKICEFYISSELIFFYSETGCGLLTCFQNENRQVPLAAPWIYLVRGFTRLS